MNSINININLSSFQTGLNQVVNRLKHLSGSGIALIVLSLIAPPIAVLIKVGLSVHFWINVFLTVLGFFPGQIHALWVVLFL